MKSLLVAGYCMLLLLFCSCKKADVANNAYPKVEVYLLDSFDLHSGVNGNPYILSISNAVLFGVPLVADADILYYVQSTHTFKLRRDIKPAINSLNGADGFAVVVDDMPVYFGIFHPSYLSSISFGVATIDPILFTLQNGLDIHYALIDGHSYLPTQDKRNDAQLLNALQVSARLR